MNTINEKTGAWLLLPGNSKEKLAKLIGISKPTLARRMECPGSWTLDEVTKLAEVLGCKASDFLP